MAYKPMWDWLDKVEGKKEGSSHANLEKEIKRQGGKKAKSEALKRKKGMSLKEAKKHFESLEKLDYKQHGSHEDHKLPENKVLIKRHKHTSADYY